MTADATSRAQLVEDLKHIPDQTVRAIYDKRYWQPASCENFAPAIAVMHFDAAVNHGVGGAIRMLQTALGVATDGEVGPQTRAAAAKQSAPTIVARYGELRRARYRALPHFWRFGRGWLRRVDATEALALSLAGETPRFEEQAKGTTDMDQGFTFPLPGDAQAHPVPGDMAGGKWWPQSKTVWGTLITAITTVLPLVGPLIGINIPADVVKVLGDQLLVVIQALGGLIGTLLALYGRVNATAPLVRRDVNVRI